MSFTEVVQRKIAARQAGNLAHSEADQFQRLRERAAPLMTAVTALMDRLSADPMFYRAMGRAEMALRRSDMMEDTGSIFVRGRAGVFTVRLDPANTITLTIGADYTLRPVFGRTAYQDANPVHGTLADLAAFMAKVENRIADFIADIYAASAIDLVPEKTIKELSADLNRRLDEDMRRLQESGRAATA